MAPGVWHGMAQCRPARSPVEIWDDKKTTEIKITTALDTSRGAQENEDRECGSKAESASSDARQHGVGPAS